MLTASSPHLPEEKHQEDKLSLVALPKSLLIVEDDLSLIQLLDVILDEMRPGLDWDYATCGEKALQLIRERARLRGEMPYSLVIADIFLEDDLTGFDVWQECQEQFPKMSFIFTSSLPFDRYYSLLKGIGNCPAYMLKPLSVSRCQSVFEQYL